MLVFSDLRKILKEQFQGVRVADTTGALNRYLKEKRTEQDTEITTDWFEEYIAWWLGTYKTCPEHRLRARLDKYFGSHVFIIQSEPLPTVAEIEANPALLFIQS